MPSLSLSLAVAKPGTSLVESGDEPRQPISATGRLSAHNNNDGDFADDFEDDGESPDDVTRRQRLYTAMSLLGDTFSKNQLVKRRYRLLNELGRGGMGSVLAAHDIELDRPVAIKLLLPELAGGQEVVARFEREAQVLAELNNDYVCKLWDTGTLASGAPYMVIERLDGHDLATVLQRAGRLPPGDAVEYIIGACHAVASAHRAGIVHRDLKPENLFVTVREDGSHFIKLLDFGLSKLLEPQSQVRTRKLTAETQVMGTPCYMAPEQWLSSSNAGPAADQWALATILFELLTGECPFLGGSIAEICGNIVNRATPSLRDRRPAMPLGLDLILRKALEKSPRARYRSVQALAQALSAFRDAQVAPSEEQEPVTIPARPRSNLQVLPSDMQTTVPRVPNEDDADAATLPLGYARRLGLRGSLSRRGKSTLMLAVAAAALVAGTAILAMNAPGDATLASAGTVGRQAERTLLSTEPVHDHLAAMAVPASPATNLPPAAKQEAPARTATRSAPHRPTQNRPTQGRPTQSRPAQSPAQSRRPVAPAAHPLPDLGLNSRQ